MAAEPLAVLLAAAIPAADRAAYSGRVVAGAQAAAAAVGTRIVGGDVTSTAGPLVLDFTVLGACPRPVTRRGAEPGDELWVTGALGGAAAAVRAWERGEVPPAEARAAYAHPVPRIREARWLAEHGVLHALIDLSDGLAGDAGHLAAASGVRVLLDAAAIPLHAGVREVCADEREALRLALGGGDDYQLCFASPPGATGPLGEAFAREFGSALTRVGRIARGAGVGLLAADGAEEDVAYGGYDHFRGHQP
jgi:thiamine-monophosphate kinase